MGLRIDRVNQEIRKKLVEVIQEEVDDPTMGIISILRVETTRDLSLAKVYYSVYGDKKAIPYAKQVLSKMSGFIRHRLGEKIRLKFLPKLEFFLDDSIEYSVYIHQKIEEATRNDPKTD